MQALSAHARECAGIKTQRAVLPRPQYMDLRELAKVKILRAFPISVLSSE